MFNCFNKIKLMIMSNLNICIYFMIVLNLSQINGNLFIAISFYYFSQHLLKNTTINLKVIVSLQI